MGGGVSTFPLTPISRCYRVRVSPQANLIFLGVLFGVLRFFRLVVTVEMKTPTVSTAVFLGKYHY